jgi:hypothetical protein
VKVTILDDKVDSVYKDFIYDYPISFKYSYSIAVTDELYGSYEDIKYRWNNVYYSSLENHHYFKNNDVELKSFIVIFKSVEDYNRGYGEPFEFLIGIKNSNDNKDSLQAFYLIWYSNRNVITKFQDNIANSINSADTIFTNLHPSVIKKIFPKYKGNTIDGNVLNIEIDNSRKRISDGGYASTTYFNGFDRFLVGNYKLSENELFEQKKRREEWEKLVMKGINQGW